MLQTHIYDFLGVINDPIYIKILELEKGQKLDLGGVNITFNANGLYELETDDYHECFKSKKQLYDGVSRLLSFIEFT